MITRKLLSKPSKLKYQNTFEGFEGYFGDEHELA
jgi:hypothetical protein